MKSEASMTAPSTVLSPDPASLSCKELYELHSRLSTEFADGLSNASTSEDIRKLHALHLQMQMILKQIRLKNG
jgi:hypothetical protein